MSRHASFTALDDWLAWLETLSPHEIELGLERVRDVLARLDLPRPAHVIHVAGTNGKGSVVAMLEALFLRAGYGVACYTSPHVSRYNERMRFRGRELSDDDIIAAFRTVEAARRNVILTYFEFGTLAALAVFAKLGADVLILEVGLGGRLDAVNAIDPDAAVITNVSLDHCEWLGTDVETIAVEKAGVMRMNTPVIFGSTDVPASIVSEAARRHADLRIAGRDFQATIGNETWQWRGRDHRLSGLAFPALGGSFQVHNASAVLATLEAHGVSGLLESTGVSDALRTVRLPGRMQHLDGGWLLDVAHNPAAAQALADTLQAQPGAGRLIAVLGVLSDKDLEGMLDPMCPLVDEWIAVPAESPRALAAEVLASRIANRCNRPCRIAGSVESGLRMAENLNRGDDRVLVTGSFYTVGPALGYLRGPAPLQSEAPALQ